MLWALSLITAVLLYVCGRGHLFKVTQWSDASIARLQATMGLHLPPGIRFLAPRLPVFAARIVCARFIVHAFQRVLGVGEEWISFRKDRNDFAMGLVFMVCVYVCEACIAEVRRRKEAKTWGAVPFPTIKGTWPGNIDELLATAESDKNGHIGEKTGEWFGKHGWAVNTRMLWQDRILTAEPEHFKIILATHFDNFEKGTAFKESMKTILGDGIFNADGETWRLHRSMTRPFFSRDRISHFDIFGRHADHAIRLLQERARSGVAVDIQDLASRFTLDSATEFLFGHCVHILSAGLPFPENTETALRISKENENTDDPASLFSKAFANAQAIGAQRLLYGERWPLFEFWKDQTEDDMKIMLAFVNPIIQEAIAKRHLQAQVAEKETPVNVKKEVAEGDTLLDHLLNYSEDTNFLLYEILNIMIAGRDTTASLLTFGMYCLAMYPDILARLREEILAVVGPDRNPTYEDLRSMKYLRAFINETLRLYPPVPFGAKSSINADTFPDKTPGGKPWYLPAGTRVIYSIFHMHRRTDLWGPDAEIFDPSRFLDARLSTYLTPNPFIFLPFNAGPRICLGQQFAYNESSFMLIRLLQAFENVELAGDAQPESSRPKEEWRMREGGMGVEKEKVWVKSHLTLYAKDGLWIRLKEASSSSESG